MIILIWVENKCESALAILTPCGNLTSQIWDWTIGECFLLRCVPPEILAWHVVTQVIGKRRVYGPDHLSLEATGIISNMSTALAIIVTRHVKQTNNKASISAYYSVKRGTNEKLTHHNVVIVARCLVVSRIKAWRFKVKVQESQSHTSASEKVQQKSPLKNTSPSLRNSDGPKTHVSMRVAVRISRALEHSRTTLKLSPTF